MTYAWSNIYTALHSRLARKTPLLGILTMQIMHFVMNFLRESVFRVGGAIFAGVGLIGGAFFVQNRSNADELAQVPAVVVARGDVRTMQPALDNDGDSIPDWEEVLRGTDPLAYTKPSETTPAPATTTDPYTPPTTVTDRFAQQFLENMLRTGAGKEMTEEDKAKIVNDSIGDLSAQIRDTLYTQADVKSVAQNDLAAFREYGNALGDLFLTPSTTHEPELVILERATTENNPEVLKALEPIEDAYAGMVRSILTVETPSALAKQQVDLLNALLMIQADLAAMQEVFTDPLGSLVRVRRYKDDGKALFYALDNIRTALEKSGIVYTSGESGLILFSLRP